MRWIADTGILRLELTCPAAYCSRGVVDPGRPVRVHTTSICMALTNLGCDRAVYYLREDCVRAQTHPCPAACAEPPSCMGPPGLGVVGRPCVHIHVSHGPDALLLCYKNDYNMLVAPVSLSMNMSCCEVRRRQSSNPAGSQHTPQQATPPCTHSYLEITETPRLTWSWGQAGTSGRTQVGM